MKTRILFAVTLAGAVLCILPKVAVPQSGPRDSQGDQSAAIEGTWVQTIAPAGAPAPFIALVWFSAGGTTGATGTADRLLPFALSPTQPISPLIGSWRQVDDNTYISSLNFFSFNDAPNIAGTPAYMVRSNMTYRLTDDNTLTGKGTGFMCTIPNPQSDDYQCPIQLPSITITGKRLIPQGASN